MQKQLLLEIQAVQNKASLITLETIEAESIFFFREKKI